MNDPISTPRWWLALTKVLCEADSNAALRLRQLRGQVPFQLFHLWQTDVVMPMLCEALPEHQQALLALQSLHQRAALGVIGRQGEWRATLKPVLLALYRKAYPYDAAYAKAHASAMTYGLAPANSATISEHFGDAEAFAEYYAQLNTEAAATAFAQAHASANAEVSARVFADDDADTCAQVCGASVRVYVGACAWSDEQRHAVFNHLAAGLDRSLATLQSRSTGERHE
ncbi:hypothetical protein NF673_13245 [Pseudomonas moraviensis]|uniref:hypothetical protein n=1 Tax=Pseudomonas moraviensis TaxID=321662 RepID=UPI002093A78B|nr:hypothetical protein [Pseudomonas moraviensis]UST61620.1 hypothetical protein NF673_13245 [Pseudomonas moraviensis]